MIIFVKDQKLIICNIIVTYRQLIYDRTENADISQCKLRNDPLRRATNKPKDINNQSHVPVIF